MKQNLLPFFNERKHPISMLVIHSYSGKDIVESFFKNQVSAHYYIEESGEVTQLVEEKNRAWHAGVSSWRGIDEDINSRSIGIELQSLTLGQSPFKKAQIQSLMKLCQRIIKEYDIKPQNIVAHSDIAPTRKADPGFAFPWEELAKNGISLWYNLFDAGKMPENNIAKLLQSIGYNIENLDAAAYAFCRRFLPEYVSIDDDIKHLVDHILPENFGFFEEENFLQTLKAVAYAYSIQKTL